MLEHRSVAELGFQLWEFPRWCLVGRRSTAAGSLYDHRASLATTLKQPRHRGCIHATRLHRREPGTPAMRPRRHTRSARVRYLGMEIRELT